MVVNSQLRNFFSQLLFHRRIVISIVSTLLFSSVALGVQRTLLSLHTKGLDDIFASYVIVSAAIALASFGFSKAVGNYLGGKLSERNTRKSTEILGVIILIVGSAFLALTNSIIIFFIGNSLVGLGIGTLFASSAISLTDIVRPADRAKAISLMELSVYLGAALGALLAGIFGGEDPSVPFVIAVIITILSLFTIVMVIDTTKFSITSERISFAPLKEKLSIISKIHTGIAETSYQSIIEETSKQGSVDIVRVSSTKFSRRLVTPSLLILFSTGIVSRIADTVIIIIFPLLIIEYGFDTVRVGIVTFTFTFFWALGIAITGPLSDMIGRKTPLYMGEFIEAGGYIIIFFLGLKMWFPILIIGTAIAGFGRGTYFPIPPSTATELVSPKDKAKILGIYRFFLDMGYVIGAILVVLLVEFRGADISNRQELFEPTFYLVIILLVLLGIFTILLLKDPKPGFRQLKEVTNHLNLVSKSIKYSAKSIRSLDESMEKSKMYLREAKKFEQAADLILAQITLQTYSGLRKAPDAFEMLQFSNKIDKVAGHAMRGVRKLHLLDNKIPDEIIILLKEYAVILELLVQTSLETISLISVRIDLAAEHSYQVSFVEEILDEIHRNLWLKITNYSTDFSPLSLLLITQSIESLEKGANTLEDAIEIIRLLSFKHQIYLTKN